MLMLLRQQPLEALAGRRPRMPAHIANGCCSSGALEQAARQTTGHMGTREARKRSVATEQTESVCVATDLRSTQKRLRRSQIRQVLRS